MRRRILVRWLVILLLLGGAALAVWIGFVARPSDLEVSVRGDLMVRGHIDESARVTVLNLTQLFDAASHRVDFATICIEDDDGYHLAHLRRLGQSTRDVGGLWATNRNKWRSSSSRPTAAQVEAFDAEIDDAKLHLMLSGYLPRPLDKIDFKAKRLYIRTSREIEDFDPNAGIDPTELASIMRNDQGDAGRPPLRQFVLAPFHKPRWFDAEKGLEAVDGYMSLRKHILERSRRPPRTDADRNLQTVMKLRTCLERLQAEGVRFYLLARDDQ